MGGVKRSLPDNWEQEGPNEEEEWVEQELPKKKYLCVGSGDVEAQWLPRWYKVPHEECIFYYNNYIYKQQGPSDIQYNNLIELTVRSDGIYDIKVAKTEHLLNGEK